VIVVDNDVPSNLTIYDGDTPDLDMWMIFTMHGSSWMDYDNSGTTYNIAALNGQLCIAKFYNGGSTATYSGLGIVNLLEDSLTKVTNSTNGTGIGKSTENIANRNDSFRKIASINSYQLVNYACNDVAMTVLPNAPIDSTTGLPIPTIACLVGESLVTLSNGTNKRIDEVEIGEVVKTLEGEHTVTNWFDQGVKEVIELEFDGGQRLTCTADHRIRTTDGWVEAGNLTDSDEVVGL